MTSRPTTDPAPTSVAVPSPILATKLFVPPLRPELIHRRQLISRLEEGMNRRMILVSAPPGSGKTTLLSEWIHGNHKSVAWLSLDQEDNDPTRFVSYVIAALQLIEADLGKDAAFILQSPRTPPMEAVLTNLINDIVAISDEVALVLDDYQLVDTPPINKMVGYLIEHSPANMHLIISTRSDPGLPLARLRAQDQLTEIRASELSFSPEEATQFIQQGIGIDLSPNAIGKLISRTEGWIAGLQLAALSMRGRENPNAFIDSFTGDERHIADYLIEEVLQRQPEEVQDFLLETSILERLNGPLCDAVIGRDDSQQILRGLEKANLFIIPLDSERYWYRYHHLFAELLHQRLHQVHGNLDPELHSRASEWYEREGLIAVALDHALSAKDYDRAMDLIEQTAEETFMRSELATLQGWFDALPKDMLRTRPMLSVFQAVALLLSGQPLDQAESKLPDVAAVDVQDSVDGAVSLFRAMVMAYQGERDQSAALANQALELLPDVNLFFRSMAAGILGLNAFYSGDVAAATEALEKAAHISEQAGNLMNAVLAICHLAEVAWIQGQLHHAKALYLRALSLGTDKHGQRRPIAGIALIGLGGLKLERNDLGSAKQQTGEGIELAKKWGNIGALNGHLTLARILLAQGHPKEAQSEIDQAKEIAVTFDAMEMDDYLVELHQVRLWVTQGNLKAAAEWLDDREHQQALSTGSQAGQEGEEPSPLLRIIEQTMAARVEIARDQSDQALKRIDPLLQQAEQARWVAYFIETLILKSLALWKQGHRQQAVETLTQALDLARPQGYIRTFIEHGEPMDSLLEKVLESRTGNGGDDRAKPMLNYTKKLLLALRSRPVAQPDGSLAAPLSERELEVLRLVANGLSNSKISQNLFISLNTVKTHIKNIHSKLHVHTRTQAIARAQELGLL
ncbi:MAG: LuxR family transcriptional regulator [Fidelibacterota bacterium]|nr:MAG: LuxR family transcriptional regulator [Candidatus Neomarinimicrobiota bacterium]